MSSPYSPQLLDHFEHPRHAGAMDSPDVVAQTDNPACGDTMRLMLRVRDGRIDEVRYQVRGCVASIAAGSALAEAIAGKSFADARAITREQIISALGGLAPESMHASHLVIDCLRSALTNAESLE